WDPDLITEGLALVEEAAGREDAGRFTVQAAIAALHSQAPRFEDTDWAQIVSLYSMLLMHGEDPVVRMNRAIAIGRRDGPESGLTLLEELSGEPGLAGHHPYYVALALFLTEIGDRRTADGAWDLAQEQAGNTPRRRFSERRAPGCPAWRQLLGTERSARPAPPRPPLRLVNTPVSRRGASRTRRCHVAEHREHASWAPKTSRIRKFSAPNSSLDPLLGPFTPAFSPELALLDATGRGGQPGGMFSRARCSVVRGGQPGGSISRSSCSGSG